MEEKNEKRENVLVSACLLGVNCRYDGKNGLNESVRRLMEVCNVIPVCPEQLGGLMTPRKPAERCQADVSRVVTKDGEDVTGAYVRGAKEALSLAELYGCRLAVLKERSPSCGVGMIYDGTFGGGQIPGNGITAELFEAHGIRVFGESRTEELIKEKEWEL